MKIAIDIDKTIVDCRSMVYQFANKLEKVIPKLPKKYKIIDKECLGKYRNLFGRIGDSNYYDEIDNCVEIINKFFSEGHQVVLLSSRPNIRTFNNVIIKWLEEHKVKYNFVVVNCPDKSVFCKNNSVDVLIDDGLKNCLQTNKAGISTILLDRNQKSDISKEKFNKMSNFYRAKSWKEVEKLVSEMTEKEKNNEINPELISMS